MGIINVIIIIIAKNLVDYTENLAVAIAKLEYHISANIEAIPKECRPRIEAGSDLS